MTGPIFTITKKVWGWTSHSNQEFFWSKNIPLTVITTLATPTKWINIQCSPHMPVLWWGAWSQRSSHGGWYAGSIASLGCDDLPATPNTLQFVEDILEWSPWSSPNAWFVWALVNQISSLLVAHWYTCCLHIDVVYSNSDLYSSRRLDNQFYIQNRYRGRTIVILCVAWVLCYMYVWL